LHLAAAIETSFPLISLLARVLEKKVVLMFCDAVRACFRGAWGEGCEIVLRRL
jgi:hypothetical protein